MPRRSSYAIELSPSEREALEKRARAYTGPYRDMVRAKVVLMAAQGLQNVTIASRLDMPVRVVYKWRRRFFEKRLPGLQELPRAGRRPVFPPRGGGRGQGDRV